VFNPLNAELNPICHLLTLLGGATIVVVSRLRVKETIRIQIQVEYIIQNYRRDVNKFSDLNLVEQGKLIIEQPI